MPLAGDSIDSISTWSGLDEPKVIKAIDEAKRVLKKDKSQQYFKKLGFRDIDYKIFFEGKWTSGKDFLPIKGDYYASYAVTGKKASRSS